MAVVIFVALMVQVYSTGYMKGDPRYGWYFTVMSLFAASMLTLVLADNLLFMYAAWEGVGFCSFLLIGFWWEKRSAAEAAKKAFITTRIGDVGFLIGIILLEEAKTQHPGDHRIRRRRRLRWHSLPPSFPVRGASASPPVPAARLASTQWKAQPVSA
jgi:NADH:ubiquinone oxidoreductase subunit 5 (subunit L)/multisubunit Na+/H+ antiporter MnhA subunit